MNLDETKIVLEKARENDGRIMITPKLIEDWQHSLARQSFEHCFDAVFDHFEQCGPQVALVPAEVLHHIRRAREAREAAERRAREVERNEALFGSLTDRRTESDREASFAAMHDGRALVDQRLAEIKAARVATP